jgi:nucleoside-diphosphate-sugar epimerase
MRGQVYNLGLDSANLSKYELALKIQSQVPSFYIHSAPIGQDPDKRNYIVSSEKLRLAGFTAERSLESGIKELIKGYSMEGRGMFRNVP